jgi:hypothetical protein
MKGRCIISHWTRSKNKIKDLNLLEEVAKSKGLQVQRGENLKYTSRHAGTVNAEMIMTGNKGSAAVVIDADGTYRTIIDNYNNPIVNVVGRDCQELCRDYTVELAKMQAMTMGGIVSHQELMQDGWTEVHVTV